MSSEIHIETQDLMMAQGAFTKEDPLAYQQWLDQLTKKLKKEDDNGIDFQN